MSDLYPVAILAGGLGTRLGDLTRTTPKCMVEVCGEPFIDHVLRLLRSQGAKRVVLCLGHLGEQVEAFVGDGLRYGLRIQYSYDGDEQLGTAGALRNALPLLGEHFFVLYGDSYLPCDLRVMQERYDLDDSATGLMAVCKVPPGYNANVKYERRRIVQYDKRGVEGKHIDYGIGILNGIYALGVFRGEFADLADVYAYHCYNDSLAGFEVPGRFYTIGTPAGLAVTEELLGGAAVR